MLCLILENDTAKANVSFYVHKTMKQFLTFFAGVSAANACWLYRQDATDDMIISIIGLAIMIIASRVIK